MSSTNVTRSLQPNHHIHNPSPGAAGREFWDFQPLVIDNGSGMLKAGFAGKPFITQNLSHFVLR